MVAFAWTATLLPNLFAFYGQDGILPEIPYGSGGDWGVLEISNSPILLITVFAATLVAALAVTLGFHTRIAAIVLWIGIVSLEQRNVPVTNSGDGVMRSLAFLLDPHARWHGAVAGSASCGAWPLLGVPRPRTVGGSPDPDPDLDRLPVLRDEQVRYRSMAGRDRGLLRAAHRRRPSAGDAGIHHPLDDDHRPADLRHDVDRALAGSAHLEPPPAPWVLLLGVSLHLGIDSSIMVGFFSYAMLASYLCFVPPETSTRYVLASPRRPGPTGCAQTRR